MKKEEKVGNLPIKNGAIDLAALTQDKIPDMLELVKQNIAEIKKNIPQSQVSLPELPNFGNIDKILSVRDLINAHAFVTNKKRAYEESAKEIIPEGINKPTFTIAGYGEKVWVDRIKGRVVEVAHRDRLKVLEEIQTKLESNLSAEEKLKKDLGEIAKLLKI